MYNPERKAAYMEGIAKSVKTRELCEDTFNLAEKYEAVWGADLCTRSAEDLTPLANELLSLRSVGRTRRYEVLVRYIKWCVSTSVPGAIDETDKIELDEVAAVKKRLVSGPIHLQKRLDSFLLKEELETIDNLIRCYYWFAFSGVPKKKVYGLTKKNIDLKMQRIVCDNKSYEIYRQSLPALLNCMYLKEFTQIRGNYTNRMPRHEGEELLRAIRAVCGEKYFITATQQKQAEAGVNGKGNFLCYRDMEYSGMFYRMYELEAAGIPPDFRTIYEERYNGTTSVSAAAKRHSDDYYLWKAAFYKN